jgi:hypothetical protein
MAYTKLFSSLVTSTIWAEDDKTRIVWITMLAISDKNGEVQGSIPGLARIAGVPVEDTRAAVLKFLSPDPDSRTKDDEGRRIEEIDGGWHLLNYQKYRDMASRDESREAEAKRKARYRAKIARNSELLSHDVGNVRDMSQNVPEDLHIAEAEAEAEAEATKVDPFSEIVSSKRKIDPNIYSFKPIPDNVQSENEFDSLSGLIEKIAKEIRKYFPDYDSISIISTSQALRPLAEKIENWENLIERVARRWSGHIMWGGRDRLRANLVTWFENEINGTFKPTKENESNGEMPYTVRLEDDI